MGASSRTQRNSWLEQKPYCLFSTERVLNSEVAQVLSYFGEYQPVYVEWLDDSSCNVLFGDAFTAKRAIFALGKPLPPEDIPVGQGARLTNSADAPAKLPREHLNG